MNIPTDESTLESRVETDPTPASVVSSFYSAVLGDEPGTARDALAPGVELHVPGSHRLAGTYRGPDAVLGFVGSSRDLTDAPERIDVIDVLTSAVRVAVYCRVTARRGDAVLDNTTIHLIAVDRGHITGIWLHNFDDLAVNEFWSAA